MSDPYEAGAPGVFQSTLPVLALISCSSFSIQKSSKAGIFFKTAGLIVIMLIAWLATPSDVASMNEFSETRNQEGS